MRGSVLNYRRAGKEGAGLAASPLRAPRLFGASRDDAITAEVHVVLDRVRRHPEARDLFHLEPHVRVDHVVGGIAPFGQEGPIAVEVIQRLVQRCARMRHLPRPPPARGRRDSCPSDRRDESCSARRPSPPSASPRRRDTDSPSDPGSAPLPAALRIRDVRDADRRRAVARRVGEVDRRLEARHQALVGIRSRIGDRIEAPRHARSRRRCRSAKSDSPCSRRRKGSCRSFTHPPVAMHAEPLSPTIGFGMNVAVSPYACAVSCTV